MTRYFTKVENGLMEHIRRPGVLPSELRLVAEYGPVDNGAGEWTLVEFDDDGAPEWMAGRLVTPTISREVGRQKPDGPLLPERIWVSGRYVEEQIRVVMPSTATVTYTISGLTSAAPAQRGGEEENHG